METIYCILDICGTKAQFQNLFFGGMAIIIFFGVAIFIMDRKNNK